MRHQRISHEPGWSYAQFAIHVRSEMQGVDMTVDRSLLTKIEKGQIPNWAMLAAFSRVFDEPFKDTLNRLVLTIELGGRPNVPFLLGRIHGYREADFYPMAAEIRRWARGEEQKSTELEPLDDVSGVLHSNPAMAHPLPTSAVDAAGHSGRSISPASASEERLRSLADDMEVQLAHVVALGELLQETVARLELGGQATNLGGQSPKRPRDRK